MRLEDICDPSWSDLQVRRARDRVIDDLLAGMNEDDVGAIVEQVAQEHEAKFYPLGAVVRACKEPRRSPLVRAKLFELMPAPGQTGASR